MLFTVTLKIHLAQKMELNREHFRAIIFKKVQQHQGPVFIDGTVNSTEGIVHSKTNFVKVVQNQLLFRKPLMLCVN